MGKVSLFFCLIIFGSASADYTCLKQQARTINESHILSCLQTGEVSQAGGITANGDTIITVRLSLASVTDTLTFNQEHVPNYYLEYDWSIFIDADSNDHTGNIYGFDVSISLSHFKAFGYPPFDGTIIEGTQHNTWAWDSIYGYFGHYIDAYIDTIDNSLVMIGSKSWPELSNVQQLDRFYFRTLYWSLDGSIRDKTDENNGNNYVVDSLGDVPYSFIDIVSGTLTTPPEGVSENELDVFLECPIILKTYPNPLNSRVGIQFELPYPEHVSLRVCNVLGEEVVELVDELTEAGRHTVTWYTQNVVNGVYFVNLTVGQYYITRKIVLIR